MRIVTAFFLLVLTPMSPAHKYYFSTSDISFNSATQSFEWVIELATHDIEYALAKMFDKKINLDNKEDLNNLKHYVMGHLSAELNGKPIEFVWVGAEVSHKSTLIYIESKLKHLFSITSPAPTIIISNTLLVDVFKAQVNTVNYSIGKATGTITLNQQIHSLAI